MPDDAMWAAIHSQAAALHDALGDTAEAQRQAYEAAAARWRAARDHAQELNIALAGALDELEAASCELARHEERPGVPRIRP